MAKQLSQHEQDAQNLAAYEKAEKQYQKALDQWEQYAFPNWFKRITMSQAALEEKEASLMKKANRILNKLNQLENRLGVAPTAAPPAFTNAALTKNRV